MSFIQAGSHLETSPQVTRGVIRDSDKLLTTVFICIFCECEKKLFYIAEDLLDHPLAICCTAQ